MSDRDAVLTQAVSPATRCEFLAWLVKSHLREVNGLGDRLRYLQRNPTMAQPNEARGVMERCAVHAEALVLLGAHALPVVEQWTATSLRDPEDAFAVGFAVTALRADIETMARCLDAEQRSYAEHGRAVAATVQSD